MSHKIVTDLYQVQSFEEIYLSVTKGIVGPGVGSVDATSGTYNSVDWGFESGVLKGGSQLRSGGIRILFEKNCDSSSYVRS
jgi:hypothetical protein